MRVERDRLIASKIEARRFEAAAGPIQAFLKAHGLDLPIENITGLGNSTSEAKALWIADKVGEGYNDFYFADDALQNVQAVKNMLDQFDVKSKVQQAKLTMFSKASDTFNKMIENKWRKASEGKDKGVPPGFSSPGRFICLRILLLFPWLLSVFLRFS